MAFSGVKTRTWDRTTPNDGDLIDDEFDNIYSDLNDLDGRVDTRVINAGNFSKIQAGPILSRPAAGTFGTGIWIATDNDPDWSYYSDGTAWRVYSPPSTEWFEFPMTIGATTTAPTKPTTREVDKTYWRRVGDSMEIRYEYRCTNATGSAAGSGDYLYLIPNSELMDTAKITPSTTYAVATVGSCQVHYVGSTPGIGVVDAYDATQLRLIVIETSGVTINPQGSTRFPLTLATLHISFVATIPIDGWGPTL